ncbi:MAG: hypothetical protein ACLR6O_04040 [Eubacterium sp.]
MFITTANDVSTVSAPLYDRMEVIDLIHIQQMKNSISQKAFD